MRIALKPATDTPSTSDISAPKSSGGSFLDILTQGTQSAVEPAKGSGSQTQSDAHSSSQNHSDDSQESSSQTAPSTSAAAPRDQTKAVTSSTSNSQSGQDAAGADQSNNTANQSNTTQALSNLLAFANLAAGGKNAALISSETAQVTTSSTNQTAPSGKQAGTTKGTQSKQNATASTDSGTVALQQAAVLTVPVVVVDPLPTLPVTAKNQGADAANTAQDPAIASKQAATADQAGSLIAATAARAAAAATQQSNDQTSQQTASSQGSNGQGQQGGPTSTTTAATSFGRDLATIAATAAKSSIPDLPAGASSTVQASSQKPAQTFIQAAATALASGPIQQSDTVTSQTTAKVIPFKVTGTNLGTSANVSSATTASSSALGTNSASTAAVSKSNSQDGSNSSSSSGHDGQGTSDAGANAQSADAVIRADAGTAQTAALGTFAAAHAAQSSSSSSASGATSTQASESHSLPSEPANASLPAGSSAVNSARVIQSMNETEMRVGMHSAEFGDISIRTMVTQQQVQAQISVDHSELVNALAAHIPAAQAKIGSEYGLNASIEVSQGGASFSGNSQQQPSQQNYKPFAASTPIDSSAPIETDRVIARPLAAAIVEGSRLDIRA